MKYLLLMWGAAVVFFITGIYIMKKKTPAQLSFYTKLSPDRVSDVPAYNKEVGKMWCMMSVPLLIGGVLEMYNPVFSILIFVLICTVGVGSSVWWQSKIEEKYIIK